VAREKLSLVQRAVTKAGRLVGATQDMALARELSRRWMPLGRRIVIVGGSLVGVELAEFLSERDREVTVLEEGATLAPEMALPRRWRALFEARRHGVRFATGARTLAIDDAGVLYLDASGQRKTAPADHVILAVGAREDRSLGEALRGLAVEVQLLGDCDGVGYVQGAMLSAARAAGSV
jgi:2,4-dienoyl-CoA reductase (NADPH2)